MKRIRKITLTFSLFVAFSVFFSGCGKEEGDNTPVVTNQQTTTEHIATVTDSQPEVMTDENGYYVTDDYVKVTGDTIRVRVEPEESAKTYMLLGNGEVIKRTGYKDEWTRVYIDNTNFYVYSEYVEKTETPSEIKNSEDENADVEKKELVKKVVIDPGKQAGVNVTPEAIGPGSEYQKQGAAAGMIGPTTGVREDELNLDYAMRLKSVLESRGYEVVLTRDSNEADITNKDRAIFANNSGATVFIRLQMNYSVNTELSGVMALTMTNDTPFNSDLYNESNCLARRLLQGITEKIAVNNQGILETNDMATINWSEIPVVVLNLGFLSNTVDEGSLIDDNYKDNMVNGIADGIDLYFEN